ncbi:MAG: hypothetical protein NVSMB62_30120 [Acidobacteriaceae bacterium]
MSSPGEPPFDSIESSHCYIELLIEAIQEAQVDVNAEIALAEVDGADRRREALQLVGYKLLRLHSHRTNSGRLLNDLRTLRRLLLDERQVPAPKALGQSGAGL